MKRLIPTALLTFIQDNPTCIKADLFAIQLPTGSYLYATDGQWDITVPTAFGGHATYKASEYGRWSRGTVTSEASFNLSPNSMTLTCEATSGILYPGTTVGMLAAANVGFFDAAQVTVYTAYMPLDAYGTISYGVETKFYGFIEKVNKLDRNKVEFECEDPLFILNERIPKRMIQSSCPWSFGDANCAVSGGIAAYTQTFTAGTGSNQYTLAPVTTFSQPDGYFTQGVITCTSGNNSGLSQTVKLHPTNNSLEMVSPWVLAVNVGDTFSVVAGCDKSAGTCASKFNNTIHYGGCIAVPVPNQAM